METVFDGLVRRKVLPSISNVPVYASPGIARNPPVTILSKPLQVRSSLGILNRNTDANDGAGANTCFHVQAGVD